MKYATLRSSLRRTRLIFISLAVAVVAMVAIAPAQPAQAAGCRHYITSTPTTQVATRPNDWGQWYYGETVWIPSSSACRDINLARESIEPIPGYSSICASFRIRFYPSSGGSYTNSEKFVCLASGSVELAFNVKNGTKYRVETNQPIQFRIFD